MVHKVKLLLFLLKDQSSIWFRTENRAMLADGAFAESPRVVENLESGISKPSFVFVENRQKMLCALEMSKGRENLIWNCDVRFLLCSLKTF